MKNEKCFEYVIVDSHFENERRGILIFEKQGIFFKDEEG